MTNSTPQSDSIPLNTPQQDGQKRGHPWKLYTVTMFAVLALVLANVCPPIKNALHDFGVKIHSFGLIGPLLFLLFNGLIIIPLALPYLIFEMTIAFLIPDFLSAMCFSMGGKLIGAGVSYLVAKYVLKQRIRDSFSEMKAYKGIEHVMQKNPIKFSLILRIIVLPLFLKNYGLAVPDSVTFSIYMLCTLITTIPTTAFNIYIFTQAENLVNVVNGSQSWLQRGFSITMVSVSVFLAIYVVRYTRKLLKELEEIKSEDTEKTVEKDIEMGSAMKLESEANVNCTEIVVSSERNEMVEL